MVQDRGEALIGGAHDPDLRGLVAELLVGGPTFLGGLQTNSRSPRRVMRLARALARLPGRGRHDLAATIESCIRQSLLMGLLPAKVFLPDYTGTFDNAIREHFANLGIAPTPEELRAVRDVCIHARRLSGSSAESARNRSAGIADLKGNSRLYSIVLSRQCGRCYWCGVGLHSAQVRESLDHIIPKHLGDDPPEAGNWAITCRSCNSGKADALAWGARADAFDFFSRTDFHKVTHISLAHRSIVLMRDRACVLCGARAQEAELWVVRRVQTGLPVPSNCAALCEDCIISEGAFEILAPRWDRDEHGRTLPAAGR